MPAVLRTYLEDEPQMDVSQFTRQLKEATTDEALDSLVEELLFSGIPAVFEGSPSRFNQMKRTIANKLDIDLDSVTVVGSARTGFSLDPQRFPSEFNDRSDIDVVVVSDYLFDVSWIDILTGRNRGARNSAVRHFLRQHRTEGYIYNGYIRPERIIPALTIGTLWFDSFQELPKQTRVLGHEFHGRLYRTWAHARYYHKRSLVSVRNKLVDVEQGG